MTLLGYSVPMEDQTPTPPSSSSMPVLHHRAAFEALLKDYKMNDAALQTLQQTPFVLLVAASGAGRNTIIERLLETGNYYYVVSDTTRPPRVRDGVPIEQNGVQYFFRAEDEVLADLKAGKFLEAAVIHGQQVSGISVREIEAAQQSHKVAITDIEVQGSAYITKVKPDTLNIFILPPSFDEWLARIRKRSHLPDAEIKNRIEAAVTELTVALESNRFVFVINDDLDAAIATIDEIARQGKHHLSAEKHAHALAADLRNQAIAFVDNS